MTIDETSKSNRKRGSYSYRLAQYILDTRIQLTLLQFLITEYNFKDYYKTYDYCENILKIINLFLKNMPEFNTYLTFVKNEWVLSDAILPECRSKFFNKLHYQSKFLINVILLIESILEKG